MRNFTTIPRLNYDFRLRDFFDVFFGSRLDEVDKGYFTRKFETGDIFFTNHARTGLRLLLNSLGLKNGARIGVQAYNCNTVFEAIHMAGYSPVFVDITKQLTIDPVDLERKITTIDALIVTHTFGIPAKFDEIKIIMGGKPVIEDCAHSFLSEYKGKLTGILGDAAVFSFGNAKFPAIGAGGMVAIRNIYIRNRFISLFDQLPESNAKWKKILKNLLFTLAHNKFIYHNFSLPLLKKIDLKLDFGGKFKWTEEKLDPFFVDLIHRKSSFFGEYRHLQRKHAKLILKYVPWEYKLFETEYDSDYNFFMIPLLHEKSYKVIGAFMNSGVEAGSHFRRSIEWARRFGYADGSCPVAEEVVERIICLPTHYRLSEKEVIRIGNATKTTLGNDSVN